jgi:hypothetical protein
LVKTRIALAISLCLISHGVAHAQSARSNLSMYAGVGGIPYPLGSGGCGDGSAAVIAGLGLSRSATSFIDLQADVAVLQEVTLARCESSPIFLGPGTYHFRRYDPTKFDDPTVAPSLRAVFFTGGTTALEGAVGAGYTLNADGSPFLLLGAGVRTGRHARFGFGMDYRSFWIRHSWERVIVPDSGRPTTSIVGSGRKPAAAVFLTTRFSIPIR